MSHEGRRKPSNQRPHRHRKVDRDYGYRNGRAVNGQGNSYSDASLQHENQRGHRFNQQRVEDEFAPPMRGRFEYDDRKTSSYRTRDYQDEPPRAYSSPNRYDRYRQPPGPSRDEVVVPRQDRPAYDNALGNQVAYVSDQYRDTSYASSSGASRVDFSRADQYERGDFGQYDRESQRSSSSYNRRSSLRRMDLEIEALREDVRRREWDLSQAKKRLNDAEREREQLDWAQPQAATMSLPPPPRPPPLPLPHPQSSSRASPHEFRSDFARFGDLDDSYSSSCESNNGVDRMQSLNQQLRNFNLAEEAASAGKNPKRRNRQYSRVDQSAPEALPADNPRPGVQAANLSSNYLPAHQLPWSQPRKATVSSSEPPSTSPQKSTTSSTPMSTSMPRNLSTSSTTTALQKSTTSSTPMSTSSTTTTPVLAPSTRNDKQKVTLLSNFWDVQMQSKIVYRYDVDVVGVRVGCVGPVDDARNVSYSKGPRDDSSTADRHRLCLAALRAALVAYGAFRDVAATVYDGSASLFTSEDMEDALKKTDGVFTVQVADLDVNIRQLIRSADVERVEIRIQRCITGSEFDMADLSNEMNRNVGELERTRKQFLELLTSQKAMITSGFTVFGKGRIFDMGKAAQKVGFGHEQRSGTEKGIKFIEGGVAKRVSVLPALLLDSKVGTFYTSQALFNSVGEVLNESGDRRSPVKFRFDKDKRGQMTDPNWVKINRYIRGVRLKTTDGRMTFVASGLSTLPIRQIRIEAVGNVAPNNRDSDNKISLMDFWKFQLENGTQGVEDSFPAIEFRARQRTLYFPMEALIVAENQRVSLNKLEVLPGPIKPDERLRRIRESLEALNLDNGGRRNEFLRMFGVSVSMNPKSVVGFRREQPKLMYHDQREPKYNKERVNWSADRDLLSVHRGSANLIVVAYTCDPKIATSAVEALRKKCYFQKINVGSWKPVKFHGDVQLEQEFQKLANVEGAMLICIDEKNSKSHEFVKLMERRYLVVSQQITTETAAVLPTRAQTMANIIRKLNLKLGGFNYEVVPEQSARSLWAEKGLMIIGYDVAHPGAQPSDEVARNLPPSQASVVGFSFNGGKHAEAFIGDYHFQAPRRESVEREVLNKRMKWMLKLYCKNRGEMPKKIFVIRDGVSEGQYNMVLHEELGELKMACEEFGNLHGCPDWCPPFALAVATKRNNARFFAMKNGFAANPPPLTVVDTDVVRANLNEAYIVTSHALQGTAKPVCYQLLHDEVGFETMDKFESLITALAFTHQINESPISIPEPVFQADEWAKRGNYLFKIYGARYEFPRCIERKGYSALPIDFDALTDQMAFWDTKLECRRINA